MIGQEISAAHRIVRLPWLRWRRPTRASSAST